MPSYVPIEPDSEAFRGQIIVLTGGASGIGEATVALFNKLGATVVFGDVSESASQEVAKKYSRPEAKVTFVRTDTSVYEDVVRLFRTAHEQHGRVNHAISLAAVLGQPSIWSPDVTLDNVDQPPDLAPLEVNLKGTVYFARVALAFLNSTTEAKNRSLTLISSDMQFIGVGISVAYQVAKSGVHQLMRSLRPVPIGQNAGVRINSVHPNLTVTAMVKGPLTETMEKHGFPLNAPEDVAQLLVSIAAQEQLAGGGQQLHGKAFEIVGGKTFEFEDEYDASLKDWTGDHWSNVQHVRRIMKEMGLPIWEAQVRDL